MSQFTASGETPTELGHLDSDTIARYEERIQVEANRIGNASQTDTRRGSG